jgi:hypothetical protein
MPHEYIIRVQRQAMQARADVPYQRTLGSYSTEFDGNATQLSGFVVERQGPGDDTAVGVAQHRRIAAGRYPLFTHAGANGKYKTIGYSTGGAANALPRPAIGVGGTGAREGILIHCAAGFLMSIGCLNPSGPLANGDANLTWADSKARVVALIEDMRQRFGAEFPGANNVRIPGAWLVIQGEP